MPRTTRVDLSETFPGRRVLQIPEAGKLLGLGKTRSHEAARAGLIPTIKIGKKRKVVPIAQLEALLSGEWKPDADDA